MLRQSCVKTKLHFVILRTAIFLIVVTLCCQVAFAQSVGWFNGTFNDVGAVSGFVFDDFVVPSGGWQVVGVFSNNLDLTNYPNTVTTARWEIRTGISDGNVGTVVASGTSGASWIATGRTWGDPGPGHYTEYRLQVSGLNVTLTPGTYWLSAAPVSDNPSNNPTYLSMTSGANAVGTPPGNNGNSFLIASGLTYPENLSTRFGGPTDFSLGILMIAAPAYAQYTINTVAGNGQQGYSGDGGPATSALLQYPWGVAVDAAGNLFIADTFNNCIRKVTPDGIISTVAGKGPENGGYSGDGGPAADALLWRPYGVAVDGGGNLFIADTINMRIRKVAPDGIISTIAGNGNPGYSGDDGAATSASLYSPLGVAVDSAGNLYIADADNHRIRKVTPDGIISTVAGIGNPGFLCWTDEPNRRLWLRHPVGVAVNSAGSLYISESGNEDVNCERISDGSSIIAGNGTLGYSGDGGPATNASFYHPWGISVDGAGNLYIADHNNERVLWCNDNVCKHVAA